MVILLYTVMVEIVVVIIMVIIVVSLQSSYSNNKNIDWLVITIRLTQVRMTLW